MIIRSIRIPRSTHVIERVEAFQAIHVRTVTNQGHWIYKR